MKKLLLICLCISVISFAKESTSFLLGRELLKENSAELAAIEFRRYALETEDTSEQSPAYLHAAYAYLQAEAFGDAKIMLDQAEALNPSAPALPILNAEIAAQTGDSQTALYFFDLVNPQDPLSVFSTRRSAELLIRNGQFEPAKQKLSEGDPSLLFVLEDYANAPTKNPRTGGLLGLIPGAGYWYSGEVANGFRSLILNSVFLFGMIHSAQEEQWGAFAAISFFEITWYSGSIYGGIDAAHRFNKRELEHCIDRLDVPEIEPVDDVTVPLFQLKVVF